MSNVAFEKITNVIIESLDKGIIPWQKTWNFTPQNLISKKSYKGINRLVLGLSQYKSQYWLTYKQAEQVGGNVKKGEKSTPVVFWNFIEKEEDNGKVKRVPILRYYSLFNLEQCENINPKKIPANIGEENQSLQTAEDIIKGMPNAPKISFGGNVACYQPEKDEVNVPALEHFKSSEDFYLTQFHELTHSTGHKSRLNRQGVANMDFFGTEKYSKEELVAELGACFLASIAGIDIEKTTLNNSVAYIQNWIKVLQNDKKLIVSASSQAQKAVNYIQGIVEDKRED